MTNSSHLDLLEQKHVLIAPGVRLFNVPYRTPLGWTNLPESACAMVRTDREL